MSNKKITQYIVVKSDEIMDKVV